MKTFVNSLLFALAALPAAADEFSSWEWIAPKPAGNILQKIVFDGTRFVGVGDLGIVLTSTNGTNWNVAYTDVTNRLWDVYYEGGRLLATGDGLMETYIISTNADVWAQGPRVFGSGGIGAICYGLGTYVMAAGYPHKFFVSPDTTAWQELPYELPHGIGDIAFGDEMFVAVGGKGLIGTSANGMDWIQRESGTQGMLKAIAFGDGRWVAVGGEGA
ncbi:MAG: hypothetical protein SFV51_24605, partial [Bryobacteraceae bacterium]|nr:hypothetical protein [Bryobacteraceae bacterium]